MKVVLASQSPRRVEYLRRLQIPFHQKAVEADESLLEGESPRVYVRRVSALKAAKAAQDESGSPLLVVAADTVVWQEGEFLFKPCNVEEARKMLGRLSGSSHQVFSGITLRLRERGRESSLSGVAVTTVFFSSLGEEEIDRYIRSGEPLDKAGAYGIQGLGGLFVPKIRGSYSNVVGFPLELFYRLLRRMKIDLWTLRRVLGSLNLSRRP